MYPTSATWDALLNDPDSVFETRVRINGTYYTKPALVSVSITRQAFAGEQPGVGGCIASELNLSMLKPSSAIPRMAKVEPFVRLVKGSTASEWIPQGKYWIDTRENSKNDDGLDVLKITAFDAMLKTEGDYPSTTHSWPATPERVVTDVSTAIGSGINSETLTLLRTHTGTAYRIGLPVGYSMREVLSGIGSMFGGNWICDYDGKLELVTIWGLPAETNYLVDGTGDAITFGGDRILV